MTPEQAHKIVDGLFNASGDLYHADIAEALLAAYRQGLKDADAICKDEAREYREFTDSLEAAHACLSCARQIRAKMQGVG